MVIVTDQPDRQVIGRLDQQLSPHTIAIALVDVGSQIQVTGIAVTLVQIGGQAEGDRVADRAGNIGFGDDRIIIAVAKLGGAAELELRLLGDDADDAGRGIFAEQSGLGAAQHFDTFEIGQIADLGSGPRTINAVNKHAD